MGRSRVACTTPTCSTAATMAWSHLDILLTVLSLKVVLPVVILLVSAVIAVVYYTTKHIKQVFCTPMIS